MKARQMIWASDMKNAPQQNGFTLIEVLVAIVVLSIGLIGLAALQAAALKNTYATFQRTLANLQIQEANERLWIIRCQLKANPATGNPSPLHQARSEWQSTHANNNTGLFMENWSGNIVAGTVNGNSGIYTITVQWLEKNTNQPSNSTPTLQSTINIPFINCP